MNYDDLVSYDYGKPELTLDQKLKEAEQQVKNLRERKAAEEERAAKVAAERRRKELLANPMSREMAIYWLGRAVDDKEQYQYKAPSYGASCVYVDNGAPSCLLGWMFHLAGIPLKEMSGPTTDSGRFDRITDGNDVPITRHEVLKKYVGPDALSLLDRAQHYQDSQVAWGDAVKMAIEETAKRDNSE